MRIIIAALLNKKEKERCILSFDIIANTPFFLCK